MNYKQKVLAWAEYVLPIFEAEFPDDLRPRQAIEAAKNGNVDAAAVRAAYAAAPAAATNAATYAAEAAADAAFAAAAADAAARAAAHAVMHANYGEDKIGINKVNLIWTKEEQLEVADRIKWLEYEPTEVWKVLLEKWCAG